MNGIESIRESRRDGYWGSPGDDYECLEAERHVDYLLAEVDRLHAKLERIERLQREAAAGRALADVIRSENGYYDAGSMMRIHYALADYDKAVGESTTRR